MLPIFLVIFLIGLLTMAVPALRRYHPLVRQIFLSMFTGYIAGFVISLFLTVGIVFLADRISKLIFVPQIINTLIGHFVLVSPILLPILGTTIGLIFSIKQRKKIMEMDEAEISA